jgi:hypothetical protein
MSANSFYLLLFLFLGSIYIFYKPVDIKKYDNSDLALLELQDFKLYDISTKGLSMMLQGAYGKRYGDRYEINDVNYTNNAVNDYRHMSASLASYKEKMLYLNGNVIYRQGDAFTFSSDEAQYDEVTKSAYTTGKFNLQSSEGFFNGYGLEYNSLTQNIRAKNILATYHLNKEK